MDVVEALQDATSSSFVALKAWWKLALLLGQHALPFFKVHGHHVQTARLSQCMFATGRLSVHWGTNMGS